MLALSIERFSAVIWASDRWQQGLGAPLELSSLLLLRREGARCREGNSVLVKFFVLCHSIGNRHASSHSCRRLALGTSETLQIQIVPAAELPNEAPTHRHMPKSRRANMWVY
jgi:hypothetical protein